LPTTPGGVAAGAVSGIDPSLPPLAVASMLVEAKASRAHPA
jgi:hypothetical protein